jgi:putative transposase
MPPSKKVLVKKKQPKDPDFENRTFRIPLKRQLLRRKTKKSKHVWQQLQRRLRKQLRVARRIAIFAIDHHRQKMPTTPAVKHLGKLHSDIANQVIRKYWNDKKCKVARRVNLIIPAKDTGKTNANFRYTKETSTLEIIPLKLHVKWRIPHKIERFTQFVVNKKHLYVSVRVKRTIQPRTMVPKKFMGIDANMKPALLCAATEDGRYLGMFGHGTIQARHKFREIRSRYQRQGRLARVKQMGDKEHRFMNDTNHKATSKLVKIAQKLQLNISMEDLTHIRKKKVSASYRYFLNSWGFYQLRMMMTYKARYIGLNLYAIDPSYTTQECHRCHARNKVIGKRYQCHKCGLKCHRDINAGINIAVKGKKEAMKPPETAIKKAALRRSKKRGN